MRLHPFSFFQSLFQAIGSSKLLLITAFVFSWSNGLTQVSFAPYEALFSEPKSYVASYTDQAPLIDGAADDLVWKKASATELNTDIEGDKKPKPQYRTQVKMLYNDTFLFLAAKLEEPHVWATLKKRDAIIYNDNDFEVFLSAGNNGHQYFEVEVNALNTILDLMMPKPYRNGSGAVIGYDMCDLQSAVQVQGSLNNPNDRDEGWSVEMAIPFRSLYVGNVWSAPKEGSIWRINFSRVQWDTEIVDGKYVRKKDAKGKLLPEHNWVWSPQGVINMHYPERWGYLQFTRNGSSVRFQLPYNEKRRPYLWLLYYKQKAFLQKHGKYAGSLKELDFHQTELAVDGRPNKLMMEATSRQFTVYISDQNSTLMLNEEGLVQQSTKPI